MPWTINADPCGNVALSALLAAVPIAYLFWALAWRRMRGHWASLSTLAIALLIAVVGYGMPVPVAVLAGLDGALFGLWPISWIILPALFVFNLSVKTGDFAVIKNSLAVITDDRRMQALLVAFAFGAFIEGCAGFGTPVAITAAVLIGLGFKPLQAAGICLLANTAPVAFGSIGIPIIVAGQVSGVDTFAISQMAGRTLPFITVFIPFYIVILLSGWRHGLAVWPAALVSGLSFAIAQFLTANYLGPMLPDIIASVATIISLTVFLHLWKPKETWTFADEPPAAGRATLQFSAGQVLRAWAPFVILTVFVAGWGIAPLKDVLDHYALFKLPITGLHEQVIRDGKPLAAIYKFNLLSATGTAVFFAELCSLLML
ncbi:MAG TPA: lactate permease LctP family transporter, partial [Planctomycetota bacterium]|nr:lactate permease LctP family transporter [Planctomycetota bacterium]